ncbi:protein FAR-RED ELONGATED HYPOCOTYL 1 isoform X2 [Canna indica]|uniref:Protein FAR-RED ELONGATED HYPOCOTYL 1 isoform X2 n=1 Tax=Canna indica TaxID=4628 RepID=A0AAQ3JRC8_9LILI|nr:protein FAR-RED ELONGATED HYPOCOTYL 1 isoform X2 [Canna indica]
MEEQPDHLPVQSKETEGIELNKKRKLQYDLENVPLPLSKHKFGDRIRSSDHPTGEETDGIQNWNEQMAARGLKYDSEELGESYNDSNSVSEGYGTTMTLDLDDEAEKSYGKTASPSVSSSNFKNNICEGNIDPFDIDNVKESSNKEQDMDEVQHPEQLEGYGDYIRNSLENLDPGVEDLMLYSNDAAPHALLLSLDGQDDRSNVKKPTIDKEFEQYFSMLML